jgi:hypothetical protein
MFEEYEREIVENASVMLGAPSADPYPLADLPTHCTEA